MRNKVGIAMLLAALVLPAGCADQAYSSREPTTGQKLGSVVRQPLAYLNVAHTSLPPVLTRAEAAPFALPVDCEGIAREIAAVTQVLGPELSHAQPGQDGRASVEHEAGSLAWDRARGVTTDLIPFRGVVRWISGADSSDHKVEQAVLAGYIRRAYLEGVRDGRCPAPPRPAP